MLRDALRTQTRAQHTRLEERLAIEERVRDRHAYVELLERFHAYYFPVEEQLIAFTQAFNEHGIDLSARLKTEKLQRDLIALGQHAPEPADADLVPEISTFPRAVGCLYVMEGSTLGGQLIMRQIGASLRLDAETGAAFYSGYGDRTGSMWQAFLKFLATLPFDEQDVTQAIDAARETFESLEQWLCDQPMSIAVGA